MCAKQVRLCNLNYSVPRAVFDFAALVSDPHDPTRWRAGLSIDQLHPSDASAEAMADLIDLWLFD